MIVGSRAGYDSLELHRLLLLDLQMREGTGIVATHDYAKPHHPMALVSAPAWADVGITFAGDPDEITCSGANSVGLDFTSDDFSLVVWAYSTNLAAGANLYMNRGTLDASGWEWYTANNNLALRTNQAGSRCGASGMGCVQLNTWQCLGMFRSGLVAQAYTNGQRVRTLISDGGLLDPITCVQTLRIGNNPHDDGFRGTLWRPRIWGRKLLDREFVSIFQNERYIFGV